MYACVREDDAMLLQIEDKSEPYNQVFLNMYLTSLLKQHLTDKEFNVIRLSYGLDGDKHSAKQIVQYLNIEGSGAYVRVSQLKKQAVDRIDWSTIEASEDKEKTLKSFFSKRIKGGIRREVDKNRGQMRLPEHVTNSIRKNFGKDKKAVAMFFNSIFLSIDAGSREDDDMFLQYEDKSEPYNQELLNMY